MFIKRVNISDKVASCEYLLSYPINIFTLYSFIIFIVFCCLINVLSFFLNRSILVN